MTQILSLSKWTMIAIVSLCLLSACGGGGTESPAPAPAPTATAAPEVPLFSLAATEQKLFVQYNAIRTGMGLPPVMRDERLDRAARSHAQYIAKNWYLGNGKYDAEMHSTGTSGWLRSHLEEPGKIGFTGVFPIDRALAEGYEATYVGESLSYSSFVGIEDCIETLVSTVFHRLSFTVSAYTHVGIGLAQTPDSKSWICAIEPAYIGSPFLVADNYVDIYPWAGQTNVLTTIPLGENPDPLPSSPVAGNPISLRIAPSRTLSVISFTLVEAQNPSTPVPTKLLTEVDFPSYLSSWQAFIVPTSPLKSGVEYTAKFEGFNNGVVFNKNWNFTTKIGAPLILTPSSTYIGSQIGSTINITVSGGGGVIWYLNAFSSYSFYGEDPNAEFVDVSYPNPQTIRLTRNSTACSGKLVKCVVIVRAKDSLDVEARTTINVH